MKEGWHRPGRWSRWTDDIPDHMTAQSPGIRLVYRKQLKFAAGKHTRTQRTRWYSVLPVWIAPMRCPGFGMSIRLGDAIFYALTWVYREPKRYVMRK